MIACPAVTSEAESFNGLRDFQGTDTFSSAKTSPLMPSLSCIKPRLPLVHPLDSFVHQLVTEKTDIYSLGMIFYSLINGDAPYETAESFKRALVNKSRPEIDPAWHEGYMKVGPSTMKAFDNSKTLDVPCNPLPCLEWFRLSPCITAEKLCI